VAQNQYGNITVEPAEPRLAPVSASDHAHEKKQKRKKISPPKKAAWRSILGHPRRPPADQSHPLSCLYLFFETLFFIVPQSTTKKADVVVTGVPVWECNLWQL